MKGVLCVQHQRLQGSGLSEQPSTNCLRTSKKLEKSSKIRGIAEVYVL